MKWLIPETETPLAGEDRRAYWETVHRDAGYGNVLSVTDDPRLVARICADLSAAGAKRVLVPGCGSRTNVERAILDRVATVESIVATDFPAVVELAARRLPDPRVEYSARDSTDLRWEEEFDAVVIVNSVLSESDRENREILAACSRALRTGGRLVGLFPSILANLDLAILADDPKLRATVDVERSTKLEPEQGAHQIFYTPLRLRVILQSSGLAIERFEIYFMDAEEFRDPSQSYRELVYDDADLVTYEYYVVAAKCGAVTRRSRSGP